MIKGSKLFLPPVWSPWRVTMLIEAYSDPFGVDRASLSKKIGVPVQAISAKACSMKISGKRGKYKRGLGTRVKMSEIQKEWHKTHEHPRGALGKFPSAEVREKISVGVKRGKAHYNKETHRSAARKSMRTKIDKYGSMSGPETSRGSWKSGWREIGEKKSFYRSRWEANYARHLESIRLSGGIKSWKHESETFWFRSKTCPTNYTPDFKVEMNDGAIEFHEVKGWMCDASKEKIKRMKRFYPLVKLIIIGRDWFLKNHKNMLSSVDGWEDCKI